MGLFPLDEKQAPGSGSLTPREEEHLVPLATWMPFERAAQLLHAITGVQVSEAAVRRHTAEMGQICDVVSLQKQETSAASTLCVSAPYRWS
jgi:hypothetical protein